MPIRIPADAKIVRDHRLTLIRAIKILSTDRLQQLIKSVKDSLRERKAAYAESDLCLARLQGGGPVRYVDPRKVFKIVTKGRGKAKARASRSLAPSPFLTLKQFLNCCSISMEKLQQFIPADQIDALCYPPKPGEPALYVETRPGVEIHIDRLEAAILSATAPPAGDRVPAAAA